MECGRLGFAGKEPLIISRSSSTPPVHFSVYQFRAPSTLLRTNALFLLKEGSLTAQTVLVGSVGVTRRLGAQTLGPIGRRK